MTAGLGERLRQSRDAFRGVLTQPDLRRLQLAGAATTAGGFGYWVVFAVYSYRSGGAVAVGLVSFIRLAGSAVLAPVAGAVADRFRRRSVMAGSAGACAVTLAIAAAVDWSHGPPIAVYAPIVAYSLAAAFFRPAQLALTPALARTPDELTAANVTQTTVESVSLFAAPAIFAVVVSRLGTGSGFLCLAGIFVACAVVVLRIRHPEPPLTGAADAGSSLAHAAGGIRAIAENRALALLVGLFAAQTLTTGALNVLLVVLAAKVLSTGASGVGYLDSAIGVGCVVGSFAAVPLVTRRRLATVFGVGITLWGVGLVVIGVHPGRVTTLLLLGLVGIGNVLTDVPGYTLLQRAVPDRTLARVAGALESVLLTTVAIGSIAAPFMIRAVGTRWSLAIAGGFLPAVVAASWGALRHMDASPEAGLGERLRLLSGVPLFAPLPPPQLEALAKELGREEFAGGTHLFSAGDDGDLFWIIASGRVRIDPPGEPSRVLSAGDSFGEIALLRNVPRTASATADADVRLYSLARDPFVSAVTGHPASVEAANMTIAARLGSLRARVSSI